VLVSGAVSDHRSRKDHVIMAEGNIPPGRRLPDFIFGRRKEAEKGGILLAGMLVTDIPKDQQIGPDDQVVIQAAIDALVREVRRDPNLAEVGMWREGKSPRMGWAHPLTIGR
jgi:hypothetical protein